MQLNICHPEIKMKEIKGTGNLFYLYLNDSFDYFRRINNSIIHVQTFDDKYIHEAIDLGLQILVQLKKLNEIQIKKTWYRTNRFN